MGGGHRFPYPKYVWSPSGGWWATPANWKRNTLIFIAFQVSVCYIFTLYAEPRVVSYPLCIKFNFS